MGGSPSFIMLCGRLRFKHLRLIDILARTGNLHKTADELNVTQPTATKILQDVEDILGMPLFLRRSQGMTATGLGEYAADYARRTLHDAERFLRTLENLEQGGYGTLSVGTVMAVASGILPRALMEMKRRQPLMTIRLQVDNSDRLLAMLERGELDLVIGRFTEPHHPALFTIVPLAREDLWVFAGKRHPAVTDDIRSLPDLARFTWILQPETSPMRGLVERLFAGSGVGRIRNIIETSSTSMILELVRSSDVISVLPYSVIAHGIERGDFARIPVIISNPLEEFGIVSRREDDIPSGARAFIDVLKASV